METFTINAFDIAKPILRDMVSEIWSSWDGNTSLADHYHNNWSSIIYGMRSVGIKCRPEIDYDNDLPFGVYIGEEYYSIDFDAEREKFENARKRG